MSESQSQSWKGPLLATLLESVLNTDKEKLTKLVYDAEGAIFIRSQELAGSLDHHEERGEMQVASAALMSIQVNQLGWPLGLPIRPASQA